MRTRRIAAAVLLAFASQVVTLPAFAQDDAVTVQARARFKEGVAFFDKGQFENARLAFLQAYALKKHPAVLLNLAQSSAKSGHPLEASRYFQQFLKESASPTAAQKTDAENGLAEVRQKLGRIEIIAPAGTEVVLDDKDSVGTAPFADAVDVEPGAHSLRARSDGQTVQVTANAGQKVQAKFGSTPTPAPVPVPVPPPTVVDPTPTTTTAPPPPVHDTTTTKRTNLLTPPETMAPVYAGLAVGGVGLVSAIIFAAFKSDAQSKADAVANDIRKAATSPPRSLPSSQGVCSSTNASIQADFKDACATLKDNNDKVDTNATIANISLVVMGVGFVTAAGWYLFAPKRGTGEVSPTTGAPARPIVVTPYGGYGSGGLSVSGSF